MMFDTHSGNMAIANSLDSLTQLSRKRKLSARFDELFALTFNLVEYGETLLFDNECWGEDGQLAKLAKKLSSAWRTLMAKTDAELAIDPEFTRPGVLCLLDQMKKQFQDLSQAHDCKYRFKTPPKAA